MANTKNAILKAKIAGVIYEVLVKTTAANVYVDDNTNLADKLAAVLADVATKASTEEMNAALALKAEASHKHEQADINGLEELVATLATNDALTDAIDALRQEMLGDTPVEAYNTFTELASYIATHQDAADALTAAVGNKADKATTLAGYGITDAYTKEETEGKIVEGLSDIDAKNVYFKEDMTLTQSFGKYQVSSSVPNVTVKSTGMSLYDLIMDAYSESKDPTKSNPKVTGFNVTGNGNSATSFEVGTTVTPQWVSTFNAGSYTYKSSVSNETITPVAGTGVTATGWEVKQGSAVIGSAEDGTAASSFVIGDGNNTAVSGSVSYSITADYSNGNYALTNLNKLPATEVRIAAGTTDAATDSLTWVRNMFGGGTSEATIDSAVVRGLTKSATASAVGSSAPFEFAAVAGDSKVVFAYPKALTTKTPKFEIFTMAWGATEGFVSSEVQVADARGTNEDGTLNNAMTYTVWTYAPAGGFVAAETKYRAYF